MNPALTPAMWAHLLTVLPALLLGAVLMVRRKGTPGHVWLGRCYLLLMLATAVISFWVRGLNGERLSFIHALSAWTILSVLAAWWAIRTGRRRMHRDFMIGLYVSVLLAGAFTLLPQRVLGQFFWS
ncbi:MAG: DUF2306 domain-containing protein [Reyranellaceae bacterium]